MRSRMLVYAGWGAAGLIGQAAAQPPAPPFIGGSNDFVAELLLATIFGGLAGWGIVKLGDSLFAGTRHYKYGCLFDVLGGLVWIGAYVYVLFW